jgi:hypothetical protein
MYMGDALNKPEKSFVKRKRLEIEADELLKKEFLLSYNAFRALANAWKSTVERPKFCRMLTVGAEAKTEREEKHLDRSIVAAETWDQRDRLFRRLASSCYRTAQWFMKTGDYKQAAKWMNLTLRFLRLSLDPKAKQQMDQVLRELAELKSAVKEREEKMAEEDDGENSSEG